MSRGNDAIPSWSGYNYQGKITLLETLITINRLLKDNTIINPGMFVEIEKNEDFIIYEDYKAKALYQVKAYLSTTKLSSYKDAMEKLITHRDDIGAITASCFLCTPLDIDDWGKSNNIYSKHITLYKPYGECVELEEVPSLIKNEIEKILNFKELKTDNVNDIYLELCNDLDARISIMHIQKKKDRNYNILMSYILDFIEEKHLIIKASDEAKQKEKVYEHIIKSFRKAVDMYCDKYCIHKKMGVCHNDIYGTCSLYKSYEFIANINIWEYGRYINPHVDDGWDTPLNYISNMSVDDFSELLIPVFNIIMTDKIESNNNIIYCDSSIGNYDDAKIIPTLLNFHSGLLQSEISVEEKLKTIKHNNFIFQGIAGNIITAYTNGMNYNTENDSILFFEDPNGSREEDIRNYKNAIRIVDSKDFIDKLMRGG